MKWALLASVSILLEDLLMSRVHAVLIFSLLLALACVAIPAQATTYTFEGLVGGNLLGQDNWLHYNTGANAGGEAQVQAGTGSNGTTVARSNTGNVQVSRANDANYSFPAINSAVTIIQQADFRFNGDENIFMLSTDAANGAIFNTTPYVGLTGNLTTTAAFRFRLSHFGAAFNVLFSDAAPEIEAGDWIRVRTVLDMAANGGDGSASVSYQDLTLGQAGFTPIPGMQSVAAGLLANGLANKYTFDRMYFRGGTANGGQQIDNLTVEIVPEPGSIVLAAICLLGVFGYRRRCRIPRV
jgi:hypothetical protein